MQTSLLGQPPSLMQQSIRTDFSNLFQHTSEPAAVSTNSSAMAIAAAKARELLKAKNLNMSIAEKSVDNVNASNGIESNHDGNDCY